MAEQVDLMMGTGRRFYAPAMAESQEYFDMHNSTGAGIVSSVAVDDYEDPQDCGDANEELKDALTACSKEKGELEDEVEGIQEELDECGVVVEELELENEELREFFDGIVGGGTFSEIVYGFYDDPGYGSITSYLSLTMSFDPSTGLVKIYAQGEMTTSGDPRFSGTFSTISASRYYKADGSTYKNIANTGFLLSTSNPTLSGTATSYYDPSFAPGGYVLGSKSAVDVSGGRLPESFTWSPLPPTP